MFMPLLALLCLCAGTFAASPPTDNPDYIYDPFNSTSHGLIFSPSRVVCKVDCPGCPIYDRSWHTQATSLIFDFTIADNKSPQPSILLNNGSFYPPGIELGWTGFTAHTSRPVPWNTTFDAYVANPSSFYTADLVGVVTPLVVNHTDQWNLTAVLFLTVAYGNSSINNTFENFAGNISSVELFYRSKTFIVQWEDKHGSLVQETRQEWELLWWQIVPFPLLYSRSVDPYSPPSIEIPDGLTYKLLGYVPQPEACSNDCDELRPALDNLLSWIHFLGAVVIIVIIVGAGAGLWWYFGEEIMKWKGWEQAKKWWDEHVTKSGGEGENAPLLAGEQNEDD